MKIFAIASLTAMLLGTSALAADLPTHKSAPEMAPQEYAFSWTGFYAGVNGGYGWGTNGATGGLVGGTLGYNYQIGQVVIGAEGDFDFASIGETTSYPFGVFEKTRLNSLMTERLRLGYAMDRTLLYVTGGYAGGSVRQSLWDVPNALSVSQDSWRNGYALGGGVEYAFTNHISAKAEYLYTQFNSQRLFVGVNSARSNMSDSLFRVGLNYRF